MIHFLLAFLLLIALPINAKVSINKEIRQTGNKLNKSLKNYAFINKKMAKNAINIIKQERKITKQTSYLKKLKKNLISKIENHKQNIVSLEKLRTQEAKLEAKKNLIEEKLLKITSQLVSLSVILDDFDAQDEKSIIELYILESMQKLAKEHINNLNVIYLKASKDVKVLNVKSLALEKSIKSIEKKKKLLAKVQKSNKKAYKKLRKDSISYRKKLDLIVLKQNSLKSTLAKLKIIKRTNNKTSGSKTNSNLPNVKKHGSSYLKSKTKKYRGAKTRAPLDKYIITKRYGNYTDPIYGIKIFNESISIKSITSDTKVKAVFNGKIIFASKTAVLKNVVIIEHSGGLHTIYANLSSIFRNIKKGKKIKKGYTIGRIDEDLVFEVTQGSYHIDPVTIFK